MYAFNQVGNIVLNLFIQFLKWSFQPETVLMSRLLSKRFLELGKTL